MPRLVLQNVRTLTLEAAADQELLANMVKAAVGEGVGLAVKLAQWMNQTIILICECLHCMHMSVIILFTSVLFSTNLYGVPLPAGQVPGAADNKTEEGSGGGV